MQTIYEAAGGTEGITGVHDEMDQRAIACFDVALTDVGLDNNEALRQAPHDYFAWTTTVTMAHYHDSADDVPDGLTIPNWSWDGLAPAQARATESPAHPLRGRP